MTNWNKPDTGSSKTAFPLEVKEATADCIKLTHTSPSNLPSGAIRYNRTTKNFEEWNGSSYVIIPAGDEIGDVKSNFSTTAPTGYLPLAGGTIGNAASTGSVRANADTVQLFTLLWNNLADAQAPVSSGRGANAAADYAANKTITLPDMRQRVPMGKAASGTGSTLGGTGGAIDHTHSVPAHYHGMGTGADLNIIASGGHRHAIAISGAAGALIAANANFASNQDFSTANTTDSQNHTHSSGAFAGRIGLVTGGVDGNSPLTSGTNNQAFITLNYWIKY